MKTRPSIITILCFTLFLHASCVARRGRIPLDNGEKVASIEIEVLKKLVVDEGDIKGRYGACFFDIDSRTARYLSLLTSRFTPRLDYGRNNLLIKGSEYLDKVTKRPALIFRTEILSISNSVAVVDGGIIRGPGDVIGRVYTLHLVGRKWTIVGQSPEVLSKNETNLSEPKIGIEPDKPIKVSAGRMSGASAQFSSERLSSDVSGVPSAY